MIRPSDIVKGHSTTYMVIDLGRNTLVQEIRTLANCKSLLLYSGSTRGMIESFDRSEVERVPG